MPSSKDIENVSTVPTYPPISDLEQQTTASSHALATRITRRSGTSNRNPVRRTVSIQTSHLTLTK